MSALEYPSIFERVLCELPLGSLVACTLVSRSWQRAASSHLRRHYLKSATSWTDQVEELRIFELSKRSYALLPYINQLKNLRALSITAEARLPSARLSNGEHPFAVLLGQLDSLQHLSIGGQDLRLRPLGDPGNSGFISGTDASLIALAKSRVSKGLPGLTSLSITSSPDLTDEGLCTYLSLTTSGNIFAPEQASLACTLRQLTLVGCPGLTVKSLACIAACSLRLKTVVLKNVDALFGASQQAAVGGMLAQEPWNPGQRMIDGCSAISSFAHRMRELESLSLSLNISSLAAEAFRAFSTRPSQLVLSSSSCLTSAHLMHFKALTSLTISGCPGVGADIPFQDMEELRSLRYLGKGLTMRSIFSLFTAARRLRTVSVDTAEQYWPTSQTSETDAGFFPDLPEALRPLAMLNVLSPTLPSWALAYLLSFSPPTLESFALHAELPTSTLSNPGPSLSTSLSGLAESPSSGAARAWWLHRCLAHRPARSQSWIITLIAALYTILLGYVNSTLLLLAWLEHARGSIADVCTHSLGVWQPRAEGELPGKRNKESSAGHSGRGSGVPASPGQHLSLTGQEKQVAHGSLLHTSPTQPDYASFSSSPSADTSWPVQCSIAAPDTHPSASLDVNASSQVLLELLILSDSESAGTPLCKTSDSTQSRLSESQKDWVQRVTGHKFERLDV